MTYETSGLGAKGVLVDLNISIWTARRLDKKVSMDVDQRENTKVRAGNYHKRLLPAEQRLEAIEKIAAQARVWHRTQTREWSDNGQRYLVTAHFFEYKRRMLDQFKTEFDDAKLLFVAEYPQLVSAAAFKLGNLFDRNEYPAPERVEQKFNFSCTFTPVPEAGDFRIDAENDLRRQLAEEYQEVYQKREQAIARENWDLLHKCLLHFSERLAEANEGEKKRIHGASMLTNAFELVDLLKKFNVNNDPQLEQARRGLERAIAGVEPEELKRPGIREDVKARVDELLEKFNW